MIRQNYASQRGFSLLELMVSMAILTVVLGVVTEGMNTMQARNAVESNKVDLTQESRQFMDQIINDIHQAGFPRITLFDPATLVASGTTTACASDNNVACGLLSITSQQVVFEGDVDSTGVSVVTLNLVVPNSGCPCTIQRGTVPKSVGGTPAYYTEVNNVMNQNIFTAYDNLGNSVSLPISSQAYNNSYDVQAIGITLYVRAAQPDAKTGAYPTVTMATTVKINNAGQ